MSFVPLEGSAMRGRGSLGLLASLLLLHGCATTEGPHSAAPISSTTASSTPVGATTTSNAVVPNASASGVSESSSLPLPSIGAAVGSNLIDRIRGQFSLPELNDPIVQRHARQIAANPDYLKRVFDRGGRYLHHIMEEIEARRLPAELALLPIVESAFNPEATSRAKAAGLWQFMPATGRAFDLSQNWWQDDRRDVIESTRAALDYLQRIHEITEGDWFLTLASYNRGENAVRRAVKQSKARGKKGDFLSIKLPKETRNYVPKLVALRNVLRNPSAYGVELPFIEDKPYFTAIEKTVSIDLSLAAALAEMSIEDFQSLNPHLRRPVITVSRTNRIVLPIEKAQRYQQNFEEYVAQKAPLVSWKPYTLGKSETLQSLARKADVSPETLAKANGLKNANVQLLPGTVLLAPLVDEDDAMALETALARFTGAKTIEKVMIPGRTYKVRKRDTLAVIAKRFGTTAAKLRELNKLAGEPRVGTEIRVEPSRARVLVTDSKGQARLTVR